MIDMDYVSEDAKFQINMSESQKIGTYRIATNAGSFIDTFVICVNGVIVNQETPLSVTNTNVEYDNKIYSMSWDSKEKTLSLTVDISPDAGPDYNVLYWDKDGNFYRAASLDGITIGSDEYDTVIVRNGGILQNATLLNGALLTVMAGGMVTDLDQQEDGALRFDYTAGDTTVITGTNKYGKFSVSNDVLSKVYGEDVSISGDVAVNDYNSQGTLTVGNRTVVSGILNNRNESRLILNSGATFSNVNLSGQGLDCKVYSGAVIEASDLSFDNFGPVELNDGVVVRDTTALVPGNARLFGGTYSNVTLERNIEGAGDLTFGNITLEGSLTLKSPITHYWGTIDANGNTIILDYTGRDVTTNAMISLASVSEDVKFQISMMANQKIGTYRIASNEGSFIDVFDICIDGEIAGTITADNPGIQFGIKTYTMAWDVESQELSLTVDISDDAGPDYGILYWDIDGNFYHTASLDGITIGSDEYYSVTVRNGGILQNATLQDGALLTVKSGGVVTDLNQQKNGALRFNYTAGDTTVITGTNKYGAFSVSNDILTNVYGEYVSISGNVAVNDYNSQGTLTVGNGTVVTGILNNRNESRLILNSGATFSNVNLSGQGLDCKVYSGAVIEASDLSFDNFGPVELNDGVVVRDTTALVPGNARLFGGTYSNVTLERNIEGAGDLTFGNITLEGSLTLKSPITHYWGTIDANGNTIILDYTGRDVTSDAMISAANVRNGEIAVSMRHDQTVGSYKLATGASKIGQGDAKGVYNWDTNTWDFKGEVIGDMDGIIEVRDENGILLANCTVNGDTEYFGRYNYTVRVDDNGEMYLDVGWNTREGRTYAADGYDNLTLATAAALPEAGTKLTIDSADDVDWFKFTLETSGRSSSYIGIEFKQWAGDLDLYLYDAAGNQLDYAKSVTDNESISLKGLAAGDYYVKVVGYEDNINEYRLAYKLPEPVVLVDEYELGNTPLSAVPLWTITGSKTIGAAIQTADDVDYYSFILNRRGTTADSVTLTFDTDFGDLDLYLFDVSGVFLLGKSISTDSGTETISLAGLKGGLYVAKVVSKDGITVANYDLTFNVREKEVEPDKLEKGGNNNTLRRATDLHTPNEAGSIDGLSIHQHELLLGGVEADVDYYKFSLLEKGSADDWIGISYEVSMGDLDLEILNADGEVVAYSRTAENEDTVSLKGFEVGDYYIRVSGYNNVANNYTLNWNVTNSSLIPSDSYEGMEPIAIRENQTITGLSIAKTVKEDETRADTFKIVLEYDAWKRSKIILTDYRSDWEDGMAYTLKDADGIVLEEGKDSEISLAGLKKGEYYLTVDTPNEDEYSEYSLIAQCLPDSDNAKDNTWSFFIYLAGDNNLEGAYLTELLNMQKAILPENVEVYVLLDRHEGYSTAQRNWTDTRVGRIRHSNGGAIAVEWMYFDGVNTNTYMNTQNLDQKKEWDTGDIKTLEAFLDWGMEVGRADNYALIMKDHGSSLGYNCIDETEGSILSIDEIADLLKADKYKDLSVVAFDQCLMGSDVVISTMEGTVDYVVASEAVGWTPNLLVMYKVLLNSLETEMTPQEVSQKIVAACNCSGLVDLTLSSFKTSGHTLSDALQAFGAAAKGFTREDWVAICKSFATAYNYGDDAWAYSDLGTFLSTLKEYSTSISGTLLDATETLYNAVLNELIDSTMITPTVYGSGLAVFNPVLSNDVISFYSTGIGQTDWGNFLYTAGQLAEDCTEYFVDTRTNLTFTDFSYSIENEAVQVTYNLGTFYGNGVEYNGLYMDKKACFTVSLDQAGTDGDAIRVVADNQEANITIKLIQTEWTPAGPVKSVRRTSTDGILSLAGVDPAKGGVDTEYDLVITSDRETTYSMSFVADWTSGSDFFDYSRSGSLGAQGNGSIDKATKLAAGNYGGLVTYDGDPDFYQLNTVYSDTLSVTVNGTGLTVQEYDADGLFVQNAVYADGKYTIIVANGNYLRVEGNANLAANEVNSYSLYISDVSSTYLSLGGTEIQLPEKPVVTDELKGNQVIVTIGVEDGMKSYQSSDLQVWTPCENNTFVAKDNGLYYFKSMDPETELESKYTSLRVVDIDHELPVVSNLTASIPNEQVTNQNVVVTAEFADNLEGVKSFYKIGQDGEWTDYPEDGVTIAENATVFFKAVDLAGNESEIASYEVRNIDKDKPVITLAGDNQTALKSSTLTAEVNDGSEIFYSTDQETWTKYQGEIEVTANATYYFKATDAAGNEGTAEYVFGNIDRIPPAAPTAVADVVAATKGDVTVSATFSDDSVKEEYSLDGETWQDYPEGGVIIIINGTVGFRGIDAAGNISEVTTYKVANIDKVAPAKPVAAADVTELTNKDVTVTATFSDDSVKKEYSLDGETWQDYPEGGVIIIINGTVGFRGIDAAGNISEVTSYKVENIDKVAPEKPVAAADVTELTNKDVTVSATFSEDSVKKEYSLDGETWQDYPEGGVIIIINGTVGFRGIDEAGNVSEVTSYKVENIDKVAPEAPASLAAIVADQTVTLNWSASTDLSGVKGYIVTYAHDGQEFTANTTETSFVIENADFATWQWNVQAVDAVGNVSAAAAGEAFTVVEAVEPEPETKYVAKFDISGNGVSDVMFVWTGANGEGNYQHGYWMDGTSTWQSANVGHPAEWENLGCYDMAGDGRADSVLVGNVVVNDVKGAYIGYYADANDTDANWTNIGYLNNADDIDWKNKVGKLTGGAANSIVWYAPELYALGAWTDGTDSWTTISNSFGGADWGLVGCGDFNGNGKDSVVMSGLGGMYFYTADLDGTVAAMGSANWSGWEVRAIGDFLGDGKDDLVLFHPEYGSMVMLADGNLDAFASIGQLDANDWFVVGAGDYNGDQKDDLLVRQYSTGMLGYYTSGDTTQWNTLGYGVDMSWIVIA